MLGCFAKEDEARRFEASVVKRQHAPDGTCCEGAGQPCSVCNGSDDPRFIEGGTVIWDLKGDRRH